MDVIAFLETIENKQKKNDCYFLLDLMQKITGHPPKMWGAAIVGFGSYHYKYESGLEGDWFLTGFSPRKTNLSVYILAGFTRFEPLMNELGKYKTGKGCLYVKQLTDVDVKILSQLIKGSVDWMNKQYG